MTKFDKRSRNGVVAMVLALLATMLSWTGSSTAVAENGYSMTSIGRTVPVFISSGGFFQRRWFPEGTTGETISFDLSAVPITQRRTVMVSTAFPANLSHQLDTEETASIATSYVIESNTAAGGALPTSGWIEIDRVDDNRVRTQQRITDLGGAQWLRVRILGSSGPDLDMVTEVYGVEAPGLLDDDWLFLGDSITFPLKPERLADAVQEIDPTRAIASMVAAVPGATSSEALDRVNEILPEFPGQFVVLAYGTNDVPNRSVDLEPAIRALIAADRTPVIPLIPWSEDFNEEVSILNESIRRLYARFPEIVPGPDLYEAFEDRTDLFPPNDVHPTDPGRIVFTEAWAEVIAATPSPGITIQQFSIDTLSASSALLPAVRLSRPIPV